MTLFAPHILARPVQTVLILTTFMLALFPLAALADDWVAERLRGRVFVQIDGTWEPLTRGDVVSDNSPIQSTLSGRATFERDNETVTIGGATIIQIIDLASSGPSNTVVKQHAGSVWVEADVRQVQHFSVETPFLAAVVKGTKFSVSMAEDGAEVEVERGRVEVRDAETGLRVEITPGQVASNVGGGPLSVDGEPVGGSAPGDGSGGQASGEDGMLSIGLGGGGSGGGVNAEVGVGGAGGVNVGVSAGGSGGGGLDVDVGVGDSGDGGVSVGIGDDDNGVSVSVGGGGIGIGLGLLG